MTRLYFQPIAYYFIQYFAFYIYHYLLLYIALQPLLSYFLLRSEQFFKWLVFYLVVFLDILLFFFPDLWSSQSEYYLLCTQRTSGFWGPLGLYIILPGKSPNTETEIAPLPVCVFSFIYRGLFVSQVFKTAKRMVTCIGKTIFTNKMILASVAGLSCQIFLGLPVPK